ncbi:hypothetical protein H6F67_16260 [Microcoleus sp. FACHB-1515]|uniref:hypothetical protein n=1 Tax=Leptolyngbya sp. FACHB-1515 TaxID=2933931 RepID=UPI0019B814E3|nr:hypothetical protein [Microcoleus sp. FACHB-1515]
MSTPSAFLDLTETLDTLDDCVGVMDDEEGNPYRPWLTIVVDTFSSSLLVTS